MPGEDWVEKVKKYRLAVDAYCDAMDHVDTTSGLGREWEQIEAAREEAERARSALLRQRPKPLYVPTQTWANSEVSDFGTEELVLGDVGQHGG
jgi:hypothetical protein